MASPSPDSRHSPRSSRDPLASLPPEEVVRFFHPTPRYDVFLAEARSPVHRIAIFFHAAYLEAFGRSAPLGSIPDYLVRHIAELVGVDNPDVSLPYPDHPSTFFAHADRVRRGLGWSKFDQKARQSFQRWLIEEAQRTDDGHWLRDRFLTRLREAKVTIPAPYLIDRMVGHARAKGTELIARSILSSLTDHQIRSVDGLRRMRSGTGRSQLQWLKDPVGIPSPRSLGDVLDRITFIRGFLLPPESFEKVHPDMRRRMTATVEGYTVDSLWSDFPEDRRRALLACYLHERHCALVDLAVEIFDAIALAMQRRSEADLAGDLRQQGPAINEKLRMFKTMAQIVLDTAVPDPAVRPEIFEQIPRDRLAQALRELEGLLRPEDFNVFDYLESRYSFLRSFFPQFLRVIEFDGLPSAKALLTAISTLRYWNAEGIRKIKTLPPMDFVPEAWKPYVLPGDGGVNRHYYELCVMGELHRALRATEVWAVGGRRYGNVEDLLIPPARWREIRDECYHELGLPQDPKAWLSSVLPSLESQIQKTVGRLPENTYAIQDEDRVRLSPFDADVLSPGLELVKDRIKASWPQARIQDILVEVNSWVDLAGCFQTLRGYHKSGADFERGLWAALIAKGCNIGTTRMASLTPEVAERSLRRIDETYLSEDTLEGAYQRLLKAHRNLPIAKWLGDETVSMSDGMRVASRVGTVRAALLPHAFAPGVRAITYYWHVSHQGPGFAAQVIGHDRDAAYVLDQIFHIRSELPIHEHFTDTHGTTETTFALSYLLGVEFCPRIKLVHQQNLHAPPGFNVPYPFWKHFESPLNLELIENFWDDVVRILASVKRGNTSARLLCLRLSSYARQNILYRALREVGRIFKTRFIMKYYDEVGFRRRINAGLNRMEFFNALARHLFYARRGENWEREMEQQLNRASALLVLANACVLWNTVQLAEAAAELRRVGVAFEPDDFIHVSPYAFEHIIPYGQYFFNVRRKDRQDAYAKAREIM